MVAAGYGSADKVAKAGDSMSGTLVLNGATPLQIPGGAASGDVLTSDSSGNGSWQSSGAGVTLDSTASDIQPLGTRAAGSTGKAADAGHVHATTNVIAGVTVSGTPVSGNALTATSGTAATWTTPAAGVTLDSTASDIQPDGTSAAAGSVGKAADAGHIHPAGSILNGVTVSGTPATGKIPTCTSSSAATWQTPASGVTIDTTSSDIAVLAASAVAGSIGLAADSGHQHPYTGLALLSGAAFTGNVSTTGKLTAGQAFVQAAVGLTDGPTIAVNAALGNCFRVTVNGNRTMGTPTNPADNQGIIFEITQGLSAPFTVTFSGAYAAGTTVAFPTLTTTAGKTDKLGFRYNSTAAVWRLEAVALGF